MDQDRIGDLNIVPGQRGHQIPRGVGSMGKAFRQRSRHLARNALRFLSTSSASSAYIMSVKSALISSCNAFGAWASRLRSLCTGHVAGTSALTKHPLVEVHVHFMFSLSRHNGDACSMRPR